MKNVRVSKPRLQAMVLLAVAIILSLSVAVSAQAASNSLLRLGSRGSEVSALQRELKNRGYFTYPKITGYFGYITRDAVIRFQRDNGLLVDGIVGPQTRGALYGQVSRSGGNSWDRDNIFWLARIIHAEAAGEPYLGKVAVGSVIMNRVSSPDFPNTIYGVIFENYKGIPQFSPVADGTIYNNPSEECIRAAQEAYWGAKPLGNVLYFFNPAKAAGTWIVNNRTYVATVGNHAFYK